MRSAGQLGVGTTIAPYSSPLRMDQVLISRIARLMFGLALALFTSGCFTQHLTEYSRLVSRTCFVPSAVYEAKNNTRTVLEGRLLKEARNHNVNTQLGHGYLILAESISVSPDSKTWVDSLNQTFPNGIKAKVTKRPPQHFVKVQDLPNPYSRGAFVAGTERYSNPWLALAPITVTLDVATFPFQVILGVIWVLNARC
jgi:hypothetical protein